LTNSGNAEPLEHGVPHAHRGAPEEDRGGHRPESGGGGDDAVCVRVTNQDGDPLVKFVNLLGQGQGQGLGEAGLDGHILGQLGVGQVLGP